MTHIALVLGGGASLGSYIGGALTEIITAVENNRRSERVVIDVITGASAGALNAALAARALRVNRHLLPWIERAWVEAADASVLLDPARPNRTGWLDVSVLEDLARALVDGAPAADDERSPAAGDRVHVGITLANLYGVPYDYTYRFLNAPESSYAARSHADHIAFHLGGTSRAGDPVWRQMAEAAVASASFPFAFPPRKLERQRSDYPGARLTAGSGSTVDMWYLDGGLFDNAPLGLARDLVAGDEAHVGEDRRYLFVEPGLQSSAVAPGGPEGPPNSLTGMAVVLAGAILGQGAASDWKGANRVNTRLEIMRAVVDRLPDVAPDLADPKALALGRYIGELAERVAEAAVDSESADAADEYLDSRLERIEDDPAYAAALERIGTRSGRARLAKLVFVLEAAAGLQNKDVLKLYLVAPERWGDLAGDFLGNFGGFFSRDWRANDFRAGKRDARRVLEETLSDVIAYEPGKPSEYRVEPLSPGFDSIPAAGKARLEALVNSEADRVMAELRPGPLASALGWAWKPVVRRWVTDRTMKALRGAR
jgi:predicted acylesterase/phospholipase RssA